MAGAMRRPLTVALSGLLAATVAEAYDFDPGRAWTFANLAGAAYCAPETLTSWSCGPKCIDGVSNVQICQGSATKAFVAWWEDQCLLAFEGTHDPGAWLRDAEIVHATTDWPGCNGCKVHSGFLNEYNTMRDCIFQQLSNLGCGSYLRTTGHSLGAALNGLAMLDLSDNGWQITESYDFGMPRAGDENFASALTSRFGGVSFRVTHKQDPVPHVPPHDLVFNWHFDHKEPEIFYNNDDFSYYVECTDSNDDTCSHQFSNVPADLVHIDDHLNYMGVHTGIAGCPGNLVGNATVVV